MNPLLQRLSHNRRGRDLVIGDIHGHYSRVSRELERVGFEPAADRLICVGDLVDRGPESPQAAEWLAQPWFFAVLGNHDASLLHHCGQLGARFELWHHYHGWYDVLPERAQQPLRQAFDALPWALEIETTTGLSGIVHAEVAREHESWQAFVAALADEQQRQRAVSGRSMARQAQDLEREPNAAADRLAGIDWVIHGHTPLPGCRLGRLGNRLWIDTMGWYDRPVERGEPRFTLIDIEEPLRPL